MMFAEKLLRKIAGRREDAIGLDIGSGSVKMADVVLRNGKPYLKRMALMEAPERAVEDGTIAEEDLLADTLQKLAAKNGFAGGRVAAALGGRNLFIREVNFPRMTEKEMREAIRWALDAHRGQWAQAARSLDVDPSNLHKLAKRLGLKTA